MTDRLSDDEMEKRLTTLEIYQRLSRNGLTHLIPDFSDADDFIAWYENGKSELAQIAMVREARRQGYLPPVDDENTSG